MEVAVIVAFLTILAGSSILKLLSDSVPEPSEPFGIASFDSFYSPVTRNWECRGVKAGPCCVRGHRRCCSCERGFLCGSELGSLSAALGLSCYQNATIPESCCRAW